MKRRLLAWLLSLCLIAGILPLPVMASDLQRWLSDSDDPFQRVEEVTVEVEYQDKERSAATITYRKEGMDIYHGEVIFLVDTSRQGADSGEIFRRMMFDSGIDYIFTGEPGVWSRDVTVIAYQNAVTSSTTHDDKDSLSNAISGLRIGEGNANELVALDKVIQRIKRDDDITMQTVFWVLGDELVQPEDEIELKLQELKSELEKRDGALITWQYGDEPSALLAKYATQYSEAHGSPDDKKPAAHAAANTVQMQEEMAADLEEIVHDHYHNVHFSLLLDEAQTLVKKITGVSYETSSAMTSLTTTIREDGRGVDVTIERQCRQTWLDFIIEVELDTTVYEKQTVIPAGAIIADHEGTNGGLHTGRFDEQIEYGLEIDLPAVELDRSAHDITFVRDVAGVTGMDTVADITDKITGQAVTLPMGEELYQAGASFSGWNVVAGSNLGHHYAPGEIITMPSGDMVLEPAFGHVEVGLEIDYDQEQQTGDNQMAQFIFNRYFDYNPFHFLDVELPNGGGTIGEDSIVSVRVEDFVPIYNTLPESGQGGDPLRVELTNVKEAVYARHIGATEEDKVVVYLVPNQAQTGKYDMVIAGPGGVKAPADLSYMLAEMIPNPNDAIVRPPTALALTSIDLEKLDVSGVTKMEGMFYGSDELTKLDLTGWDTSSVTDMESMFSSCENLKELDVSGFDTSKVTEM